MFKTCVGIMYKSYGSCSLATAPVILHVQNMCRGTSTDVRVGLGEYQTFGTTVFYFIRTFAVTLVIQVVSPMTLQQFPQRFLQFFIIHHHFARLSLLSPLLPLLLLSLPLLSSSLLLSLFSFFSFSFFSSLLSFSLLLLFFFLTFLSVVVVVVICCCCCCCCC
uniref:Uncharacterized protein n=1 Tax=Cacopsylla melanoneura TaxID=428564 RepID=A0A8D9EVW3_9HEMI